MTDQEVNKLWDDIVKFASYSFNKSHAAAYALIAYRTAYLKKHYPVEFMAATISSQIRNTEKMSFYLESTKQMGITILPPDINLSQSDFSVEQFDNDKVIRFGLSGIKNIGDIVLKEIMDQRPFASLQDFINKVDNSKINKRIIENLIKAGAFSKDEINRNQQLHVYADMLKNGDQKGQMTLFGAQASSVNAPAMPPPTLNERLSMEKEVLGVFVTGHPLDEYKQRPNLDALNTLRDGKQVEVMGLVNKINVINTKNGDQMAFVTIEDKMNKAEVVVFPNIYREVTDMREQQCVFIEGQVDQDKIIASRVSIVPKQRIDA
jgi:DNA polymerase-3 subunit alpha